MKIATLVCLTEGEVDGDVETFDVSNPKGLDIAIDAWKQRIRDNWDGDSEEEILSRIEDGIIQDYSYKSGPYSFQLFWSELNGTRSQYIMEYGKTFPNFKYDTGEFHKIACIRIIREITGAGLKEAKDFTEGCSLKIHDIYVNDLETKGVYVRRLSE